MEKFERQTVDGIAIQVRVRDGWVCWSSDWIAVSNSARFEHRWELEGVYRQKMHYLLPLDDRESEQAHVPSHEAEAREYALEQHLKAADSKRAAGVVQGGEATQSETMLGRNGRGRRRRA